MKSSASVRVIKTAKNFPEYAIYITNPQTYRAFPAEVKFRGLSNGSKQLGIQEILQDKFWLLFDWDVNFRIEL